MKYLYFDTGFGFTPVMALGAMIDMYMEKFPLSPALNPFNASVYTQNVTRGCCEGCFAHIDLEGYNGSISDIIEISVHDNYLKKLMLEFLQLSPGSDLREVLEATGVRLLVEEYNFGEIIYSAGIVNEMENTDVQADKTSGYGNITESGYALFKFIGAVRGVRPSGELIHSGFGADIPGRNDEGVLSVHVYDDTDNVFDSMNFELELKADAAVY